MKWRVENQGMSESEINIAFKPQYEFGELNDSVLLFEDEATMEDDQGSPLFSGTAEVRLDLLPQPGIHVYVKTDQCFLDKSSFHTLVLKSRGLRIDGRSTKYSCSQSSGMSVVKWCPWPEPIIGRGHETTEMKSLVFHLFNFKEIFRLGPTHQEQVGSTSYSIQHVPLQSKDWKIDLRSLPQSSDTFKKLDKIGGYGLTHIGRLVKQDGSSFTGKEALEMMDVLSLFFSFAKGAWCQPICLVGLDENSNKVWESWSSARDFWSEPLSWFDEMKSQQIADLFPDFMNRLTNGQWQDTLREVIYWYLNSNKGRADVGIILTQTAIERLSFDYVVKERRLLEAEGFKTLRASDKFRLLFSSLDIPIDIPKYSDDIQQLAKQFNWLDTPQALTEIRNSLVHPEHKRRGQFNDAELDAWNLGLWYLELTILRLCGYTGTYHNRLLKNSWVGQVEDVPWK
jgi:hypothetical protein